MLVDKQRTGVYLHPRGQFAVVSLDEGGTVCVTFSRLTLVDCPDAEPVNQEPDAEQAELFGEVSDGAGS